MKKQPNEKSSTLSFTRRGFLKGCSMSTSGVLLRSLATGLPPAWFLRNHIAQAQTIQPPQTLILSTSSAGDPVNANCPGSYVEGIFNNPILESRVASYGQTSSRAAAPWSDLPEALRQRLAFVHHSSRSSAHPEHKAVMSFHGSVKNEVGNGSEMFASAMADLSHSQIGTLQKEPLPLSSGVLTFKGQPLQSVRPSEIKALFASEEGNIADLRTMRDATLDALYRDFQSQGTKAQRAFVDRYAASRTQARQLGEQLGTLLERIPVEPANSNSVSDQVIAAVALAQLKIAPVITINILFGRDNHNDDDLSVEAEQTISGVAAIGQLWQELNDAGVQDDVTFALLNVFGRTPQPNAAGGRNHNRHHNVMVAFGSKIQGGVYGGVSENGRSKSIDPVTGQGVAGNNGIGVEQTLEAAGKSLARALNHDEQTVDSRIYGGQLITPFLKTS